MEWKGNIVKQQSIYWSMTMSEHTILYLCLSVHIKFEILLVGNDTDGKACHTSEIRRSENNRRKERSRGMDDELCLIIYFKCACECVFCNSLNKAIVGSCTDIIKLVVFWSEDIIPEWNDNHFKPPVCSVKRIKLVGRWKVSRWREMSKAKKCNLKWNTLFSLKSRYLGFL